ncbi:hypothetical protein ASF00_10610 [Sphingomonas sp. Leaf34]|uniref:hypothetical protein n=1 Tax=Sphingomonas sp. Leaf34 TaxID=1736216 RepID=UPI0006F4E54C|nr:hypothetical protein [Sphingomonas sp. Leaf34]KQN28312.1 hypothetical protein ASF00_10610 [Sphingomonas sp. Leaf34]
MILPALALTMTTLGLQRFTAAQVEDDIDLSISHVGLTDTAFVVAPTLTALPGEFRRLDTISGKPVGNNIVHMVLRDDADLTYGVRGLGLFLADGTLFAVVGQVERIFVKAQVASFLLAIDVAFGSAGATAVGILVATLAPQWTRICRLALGNVEPGHTPLPPRPFAEASHS